MRAAAHAQAHLLAFERDDTAILPHKRDELLDADRAVAVSAAITAAAPRALALVVVLAIAVGLELREQALDKAFADVGPCARKDGAELRGADPACSGSILAAKEAILILMMRHVISMPVRCRSGRAATRVSPCGACQASRTRGEERRRTARRRRAGAEAAVATARVMSIACTMARQRWW